MSKPTEFIAEFEGKLAIYAHLVQAMDDVNLGRVQDAHEAYDDIIAELDTLDLTPLTFSTFSMQSVLLPSYEEVYQKITCDIAKTLSSEDF